MPISAVPRTRPGNTRTFFFILLIGLLLMVAWRVVYLLTDWFWFIEVGYENVFKTTIMAEFSASALFGILFFVIFYLNLFLAVRLSSKLIVIDRDEQFQVPPVISDRIAAQKLLLIISLILAFFAAQIGLSQWENLLLFLNGLPFGIKDPIFGNDIGFYAFSLPLLKFVQGFLMGTGIITLLATGVFYFLRRSFHFVPPRTWKSSPAARVHMTALAAGLFLVGAFGAWLELYQLLFIKRGVVYGPGYTDATTQVWVLQALIGAYVLAAAALVVYIFRKDWRIPAALILAIVLLTAVGRGVYPSLVQKFKVIPNEVVLEKPYLDYNIRFTRAAYGIDSVEEREYAAEESLTREDLRRNEATIKNIRLWNHGPLLSTYSQLQEIRTYYKFGDVDNDRYVVDGEYRQTMLSPREMSYEALPSRSWVNEHLTYTHGYGAVLSPVNRITQEGLPEFFIKDIPPLSSVSVNITRPQIYFGEKSNEYVFVGTKRPEFDYPVGDKNVYASYEGSGGVTLSFWKKLLFAARFGSFTILFSNEIGPESRVMFNRQIRDRLLLIAPFLRADYDPYLVITEAGRLVWIIDGYTVTDKYPYSEPTGRLGNYIRNSVKATVDAYDGTVKLYISDPADPIIQTYNRIFPGAFLKLEEMPADLLAHIRYPHGLFAVQAHMYRAYHMQDPQVFYNKEDLWSIPGGQQGGQGQEQEMEPYYTIMRLPGQKQEEYILLLPFTPSQRDNMSAWMAARCDAANYGKLIVYVFPKQRLVYGPRQIDARIDQDTEISKQLSLWSQRGSQVIRGSMLAIPIEKSILYVGSLYLAAEKGRLPELKRVLVAYGNSIAMEETLEQSLQKIFGGQFVREKAVRKGKEQVSAAVRKSDRDLAIEALSHYRKAQEYLKQGNWGAYGDEMNRMAEILQSVEKK
ncbi:MAG: UPF0182 family protein [Syntrophaceae bacterium]